MYPMPPLADLMPFVGVELIQVRVGTFDAQFKFHPAGFLNVLFRIEYAEPDGAKHPYDFGVREKRPLLLHYLLQSTVRQIEREEFSFTLRFSDGAALTVFTELGPYECGQLSKTDDVADMVVF